MPHCYVCRADKPSQDFQTDKSRFKGVRSMCRACNRQASKDRKRRAKLRRFLATIEP